MAVRTYLKAALLISIFLAAVGPAAASPPTEAQPEFPADGAVITGNTITYNGEDYIWTKLTFIPGATAVKHTGYFSEDYSKVESRAEDANLGSPPYGQIPGWEYAFFAGNPQIPPAIESLVRGTKYYWTVDATDALGNTFAGDIWEFTILGFYAFEPSPPNEATFVETDVLLSWQPGFGVVEHDIYMGTSWEDVNNAVYHKYNQPPEFVATVEDPNILVTGLLDNTRYYWRIDQVDCHHFDPFFCIPNIYKGDVWCFTTEPEGLDMIRMDLWWNISCPPPCFLDYYYYPNSPDETRFLTSFDSGTNLGEDYGGMIYGWLHPRKSGDYTFWLSTDEDGDLFLSTDERASNMERIAYIRGYVPPYNWYHSPSQQSAPIPLVAGQKYYIMARWQEGGGGDHCMVAWQGPDQPLAPVNASSDAVIPGSRLSLFVQYWARNPDPRDGQTDVMLPVNLKWEPGDNASEHNVYIGTNFNAVENAFYDPRYPPPTEFLATTTEPNLLLTGLDLDTTYYWRVDEIDPSPLPPSFPYVSYYKGDVWSFTTGANRIFVDVDANGANNGTSWENAYNFLQDALADANSSEKPVEIRVAGGIYTPDSNSFDPNGSGDRMATFQLINSVTLKGGYAGFGEADPDARDIKLYETILSGDLDSNDVEVNDPCDLLYEPTRDENSYHVVTGSGTDSNTVLHGFTITAGNDNRFEMVTSPYPYLTPIGHGAGMCNHSGSPTVNNCMFIRNTANRKGGGMCNVDESSPTITNCTFSGNIAEGETGEWATGGGMYNYDSSPTITNCTFSSNSASYEGGGVYNQYGSPNITNCTFTGNSADDRGGGIYIDITSNQTLSNCIFLDNLAKYFGGAMVVSRCSPKIINCIFTDNKTKWHRYGGGGISCQNEASPTLINCKFIGNVAQEYGGGMCNAVSSSPTLLNCTFTGNLAGDIGGGIWNRGNSNPTLFNCIIWGNEAQKGPEIAVVEVWDGSDPSIVTVFYSDVRGGEQDVYIGPDCALIWGEGNIDADPCFVDATGGNLRLSLDSPCIDVGDNNAPNLPATDFDGHPRIIDGDCNDTEVVDMGAYEFNYTYIGDFDYNCGVDFVDLSIFGLAWMSRPGDFNWDFACNIGIPANSLIDWRDVAIVCNNWLSEIP